MAIVRCPGSVSSITTSTSGTQTLFPITVTTAEAASLCNLTPFAGSTPVIVADKITGASQIYLPSVISSITVNGNVYSVTNGISSVMSAVDHTSLMQLSAKKKEIFHLTQA